MDFTGLEIERQVLRAVPKAAEPDLDDTLFPASDPRSGFVFRESNPLVALCLYYPFRYRVWLNQGRWSLPLRVYQADKIGQQMQENLDAICVPKKGKKLPAVLAIWDGLESIMELKEGEKYEELDWRFNFSYVPY